MDSPPRLRWIVLGLVVLVTLIAIPILMSGYDRTRGGEIGVVREGGMFDDNRIKTVLDPSSKRTWIGLGSEVHRYPAAQRVFIITTDPKRASTLGVDTLTISSNDGVNMGIEGALYFTLNRSHETVRQFDERFGTRKFRSTDDHQRYPWDGQEGWSAWFNQIIRPIIDNSMRSQISGFRCQDLIPACAFLDADLSKPQVLITSEDSKANFTKIQNSINQSLAQDVNTVLGAPFLIDFRFVLTRITLPPAVQNGIDNAQAKLAQVFGSTADIRKARADALADKARKGQ